MAGFFVLAAVFAAAFYGPAIVRAILMRGRYFTRSRGHYPDRVPGCIVRPGYRSQSGRAK